MTQRQCRVAARSWLGVLLGVVACTQLDQGALTDGASMEPVRADAREVRTDAGAGDPDADPPASTDALGTSPADASSMPAASGASGNENPPTGVEGAAENAGAAGATSPEAAGGASGAEPAEAPGDAQPVTGKVIDYYGRPVADVDVAIGDNSTTTNEEGRFTLASASAPYDVELHVRVARRDGENHLWLFRGLTRRDPVLQVLDAGAARYSTLNIEARMPSEATAFADNTYLGVTFTGPGWTAYYDLETPDGARVFPDLWSPEVVGTVQGLVITHDEGRMGIPLGYGGYISQPFIVVAEQEASVVLDLSDSEQQLPAATLRAKASRGGAATWNAPGRWEDFAFLRREADGSALRLGSQIRGDETLSYVVPRIANTSIFLAAAGGDYDDGPYSVTYRDGLAADSSDAVLELGSPPELLTPADGTTGIGPGAEITWRSRDAGVHVVRLRTTGNSATVSIVTTERSVVLPPFKTYFTLPREATMLLQVEKHLSFGSVDQATTEDGFLSPLARGWDDVLGPGRGSDTYMRSIAHVITTAP